MRLLWARVGVPYSPATGLPIESQTVSQMVDRILALPDGTRLYLLAPVVRGRKGEYRKELAEFLKKGYQRVKVDGKFYEIAEVPALDKKFTHDIDVVVDRIVVRADIGTRLADSLEQALKLADGLAIAEMADGGAVEGSKANKQRNETAERLIFSEKFACPVSGFTIPEIEPGLFSFNNPFGACPKCGGLGVEQHIDPELVVPDKDRTLRAARSAVGEIVEPLLHADAHGAWPSSTSSRSTPSGRTCRRKRRSAILNGSGEDEIRFAYDDGMRSYETKKPFEGVVTNLERRWRETESDWAREEIAKYFHDVPCDACKGYRLKPEALCVKVAGQEHQRGRGAVDQARGRMVLRPARAAQQAAERDRDSHPEGNPRPAEIPRRRRAGISHARRAPLARCRRREPAHPARLADRLGADRRALCAGRAEHRPAPARQCAAPGNAEAPARPRQHRDRGGA